MRLRNLLNEANIKEDSISDYRVDDSVKPLLKKTLEDILLMAGSGQVPPQAIHSMYDNILSARKKYFTKQQTPGANSAAVEKGKISKLAKKAAEECSDYVIGLLSKDIASAGPLQPGYKGDEKFGHEFALMMGTDPNKKLQKKYDDLLKTHWPKFRDKYKLPKDIKIEEL